MTQRKTSSLTVTIFKDQNYPRSFEVPFSWLTRLGFWVALALLTILVLTNASLYYYRVAKHRGAFQSNDLEQQILSLQSEKSALEAKLKAGPSTSHPQNTTPLTADHPFANLSVFWDGAFPALDQVPVKLSKPQWSIQSGKLRVHFFIQYAKEDGGSQQGKLMLLARGPDVLMSYPPDLLNLSDGHTLIDLDQAETFSVSRIREVKADFEISRPKSRIKEIHVLLFDNNDQPLLQDRLILPSGIAQSTPSAAAPESTEAATPSTASEPAPEEKPSEATTQ